MPLQPSNGRARGCPIRHLDEAKAAWAAGLPIGHHPDGVHRAIRFKEGAEGLLGGRKRQVPHKDVHVGFPSCMGDATFPIHATDPAWPRRAIAACSATMASSSVAYTSVFRRWASPPSALVQ